MKDKMMLTKSDEFTNTPEQDYVLDVVNSATANIMVNSYAGTGKTTMLGLIEAEINEPMLCLAFNKSIAEEMQSKFKESSECRTCNSLGYRVWGRACIKSRLNVDVRKNYTIFTQMVDELKTKSKQTEAWDAYNDIIEAIGLAKNLGYVPPGAPKHVQGLCDWEEVAERCDQEPSEIVYDLTNKILLESIKLSYDGTVDFDDQIYMPALFGGAFPRFPIVMVDERQDFSPCNVQMLRKLKGRLIAVGDRYQSIYGFRGAETDGIPRGVEEFSMHEANLSVSFRCPRAIVENVRWRVPAFNWIKEGGHVEHLTNLSPEDIQEGSAIICRNNAPLFRLAFHLLSSGRSVTVAGSDIGPRLVRILKKFGDQSMDRPAVLTAIDEWLEAKLEKGSSTAPDMADAMRVFAGYGNNLGQILAAIDHLFAGKGTITLTTGHKAKGLEWDTVYHLDNGLIRSGNQEDNLRYVIDTRAKQRLFYINSEDIQ